VRNLKQEFKLKVQITVGINILILGLDMKKALFSEGLSDKL
jgi:hypothetical protein